MFKINMKWYVFLIGHFMLASVNANHNDDLFFEIHSEVKSSFNTSTTEQEGTGESPFWSRRTHIKCFLSNMNLENITLSISQRK